MQQKTNGPHIRLLSVVPIDLESFLQGLVLEEELVTEGENEETESD